jgi:Fic family protein
MVKNLEIVSNDLLKEFKAQIDFKPLKNLTRKSKEKIPFDYFSFYTSVSSVYSSKIEGEQIEADSYLKHKFLKVKYEPDYTKKADDLFTAYTFSQRKKLNKKNVLNAHKILSQHLLSPSQRGVLRINPMFVLNENDRIEYVACDPKNVKQEWDKLFNDIKKLRKSNLSTKEIFYYASFIHLIFLKIHPLQDGNGRTARLIEKWFLREKIGEKAIAIELEKNYYSNKPKYYQNIRAIGLEYETLTYQKGLNFLLMTIQSLVMVE